jgi:hypothetical protein
MSIQWNDDFDAVSRDAVARIAFSVGAFDHRHGRRGRRYGQRTETAAGAAIHAPALLCLSMGITAIAWEWTLSV